MINKGAIIIISLLFLVKALLFSFHITPLWDIPDEIGHFAYARDIAQGRGIPLLGESEIQGDIIAHLTDGVYREARENWIAQHPPVYHLLAAIPLRIGLWLTDNQEILFRLPRVISAISSTLALLVVYRLLTLVNVKNTDAVAITACLAVLPMLTHLSSGTNHDTTLLLFSALATYFWVRYILNKRLQDAYWCALWLAVATTTKLTALVILIPMVTVIWFEMEGGIKQRLLNGIKIGVIAFSLPSIWLMRNLIHFGNPVYNSTTDSPDYLAVPLDDSLWEYLSQHPITDQLVLHFIGLFGWLGSGEGLTPRSISVQGIPRSLISVFICLSIFAIATYLTQLLLSGIGIYSNRKEQSKDISRKSSIAVLISHFGIENLPLRFLAYLFLSLGVVLGLIFYEVNYIAQEFFSQFRIIAIAMMVFAFSISIVELFFPNSQRQKVVIYSCLIFVFFSTVHLWKIHDLYLLSEQLRGLHGRMYFVVLPMILTSFAIAINSVRIPTKLMLACAIILTCAEFQTFLAQVIPFYYKF